MRGIQAIFIQESYFMNYCNCLFSLLSLRKIDLVNQATTRLNRPSHMFPTYMYIYILWEEKTNKPQVMNL